MEVGLPFGAFLAAILVLIPLPTHWRAGNVSTITIIVWLFVVNVIQGINAILWAHNVEIRLVSWCDIIIRVSVGSNIALPVACFCLCMQLERVASVRLVHTTQNDRRKYMILDLLLCIGVPAIYIGLFYVVQGHRFDIVEGFGCRPESYVSIPEFFLMRLPPIVFSIGTFVFAGMAFIHFLRRRATFAAHLQRSTSTLTPARYFRLMAMALFEMFWSLLVSVLNMWYSYSAGLRPWISWSNVHSNFSRIGQFPTIMIPRHDITMTYFLWWTIPVSAYIFFVFFAFGQDTMKDYRAGFLRLCGIVLPNCMLRQGPAEKSSLPHFTLYRPASHSLVVAITESKIDDSQSRLDSSKSSKHTRQLEDVGDALKRSLDHPSTTVSLPLAVRFRDSTYPVRHGSFTLHRIAPVSTYSM
ncbi:Pheromone B beta 1 receptor [Sparassis crispa]|uniref:Pheromone B beta 1 receptor n=1 Tax=Sparassis crispa TaxID=139825 RepID=A0A401GXU3_9APHY|nr:Pheromone B beta 1 receptor [Sparassis crispa]GBE87046.1 Pheromone B beta 1 receptor [Sparassis crispa]